MEGSVGVCLPPDFSPAKSVDKGSKPSIEMNLMYLGGQRRIGNLPRLDILGSALGRKINPRIVNLKQRAGKSLSQFL